MDGFACGKWRRGVREAVRCLCLVHMSERRQRDGMLPLHVSVSVQCRCIAPPRARRGEASSLTCTFCGEQRMSTLDLSYYVVPRVLAPTVVGRWGWRASRHRHAAVRPSGRNRYTAPVLDGIFHSIVVGRLYQLCRSSPMGSINFLSLWPMCLQMRRTHKLSPFGVSTSPQQGRALSVLQLGSDPLF